MSWKMQRATGVRDKWLGWLGGHFSKIDFDFAHVFPVPCQDKVKTNHFPGCPLPQKDIFCRNTSAQVQLADLESTPFQRLKLSVAYIHRHSLYKRAIYVVFLAYSMWLSVFIQKYMGRPDTWLLISQPEVVLVTALYFFNFSTETWYARYSSNLRMIIYQNMTKSRIW
jgi:hypothetical protein